MASDYDAQSKIENLKSRFRESRSLMRLTRIEESLRNFRPGERLVLYTLSTLLALSTLALLSGANTAVSTLVPSRGGSITEGIIGPIRFVNPLLALSGPDKDLSTLVYSGLMRATPEGTMIPDLAASVETSDDGTVYTFTLREGLVFHDGQPLTSADVLFTVQRAQSPDIKSTHRADWEGVSAAAPDKRTIIFTLPHAYVPFLENTTLGILPKHLWNEVSPEEFPFASLNTHPVGSGPFMFDTIDTNSTGAITRLELSPFKKFALGEPNLRNITFLFYPSEEALMNAFNGGRVDSASGISPAEIERLSRKTHIIRSPLPRVFGIFFNQNKNTVFAEPAVRSALSAAITKDKIVQEILKGYGEPLDGPLPPGVIGAISPATPRLFEKHVGGENIDENRGVEKARAILSRGGWTFDEAAGLWKKKNTTLSFSLATADGPELASTAQAVATMWQKAGIKVDIHIYPLSELNSAVLRPRSYEAVLFGEIVGRTLDLFAFWHSSQRNDPGLNLALYTNSKVDTLLTKARTTQNRREREKLYEEFSSEITKDQPAIFLFAPQFIYLVPEELRGVQVGSLTSGAERFLNAHQWYTDTERVWNIFANTEPLSQ